MENKSKTPQTRYFKLDDLLSFLNYQGPLYIPKVNELTQTNVSIPTSPLSLTANIN
jgi:hypothetical protein